MLPLANREWKSINADVKQNNSILLLIRTVIWCKILSFITKKKNTNQNNSNQKKNQDTLLKVLSKSKNHCEDQDANMSSFNLIHFRKDKKFLHGKAGRRQ